MLDNGLSLAQVVSQTSSREVRMEKEGGVKYITRIMMDGSRGYVGCVVGGKKAGNRRQ